MPDINTLNADDLRALAELDLSGSSADLPVPVAATSLPEIANDSAPGRIEQEERLFTVRPRSFASDKRGEACAFKLTIPTGVLPEFESMLLSTPGVGEGAINGLSRIVNSDGPDESGVFFIGFMCQSLQYNIQERSEIMHTFGGKQAVYFYGEAPVIVNIAGLLMDDLDNDQFVTFMTLYRTILAGSPAAREYCTVELVTPNSSFVGSFLSIGLNQTADRDTDIGFSAQLLAKSFSFTSTDTYFKGSDQEGPIPVFPIGTRPSNVTKTQADINSYVNEVAKLTSAELTRDGLDSSLIAGAYPTSITAAGRYTRGLSPSSTFADVTGWIPEEIGAFFDSGFDLFSEALNVLDPVTDLLDDITGFTSDLIGMVENIENRFDDALGEVLSATNKVFRAVDKIEDLKGTVMNFPSSLSDSVNSAIYAGKFKVNNTATTSGGSNSGSSSNASDGAVLNTGNSGGDADVGAVLGSSSVSSSTARKLVSNSLPVGATRGTPTGAAALARAKNTGGTASLVSSSTAPGDTGAVLKLG